MAILLVNRSKDLVQPLNLLVTGQNARNITFVMVLGN